MKNAKKPRSITETRKFPPFPRPESLSIGQPDFQHRYIVSNASLDPICLDDRQHKKITSPTSRIRRRNNSRTSKHTVTHHPTGRVLPLSHRRNAPVVYTAERKTAGTTSGRTLADVDETQQNPCGQTEPVYQPLLLSERLFQDDSSDFTKKSVRSRSLTTAASVCSSHPLLRGKLDGRTTGGDAVEENYEHIRLVQCLQTFRRDSEVEPVAAFAEPTKDRAKSAPCTRMLRRTRLNEPGARSIDYKLSSGRSKSANVARFYNFIIF